MSESPVPTARGVAISLDGVRKVFDPGRIVVESMNLQVDAGEFLAILGPSGCGKSTLLRIIARLLDYDAGHLSIAPDNPFQTAYVFQEAHLLPWRTVLENAALPLELMNVERDAREAKARSALELVGLGDTEKLYPSQLSGGMKMRVSLARALATDPKLLLLDEPFAALDEINRFHLDVALRALWQARGMTVIFVTHSISEAAFLANRAVVLTRRKCHIKLDRRLELPALRDAAFRTAPELSTEMNHLLEAMEVE